MPGKAPAHWYKRSVPAFLLLPLSAVFRALAALRRWLYRMGVLSTVSLSVPVIVVGNIAVGGSGKTPVVQWLVQLLRDAGYRPGVVSRGYGGNLQGECLVGDGSTAVEVGDEPLLLSRTCACPVAVGRNRPAAAQLLIEAGCNVVVADDGMQHYRLARDIEIAVLDPATLGNGWLLPAGPLREPLSRLSGTDLVIAHGRLSESVSAAVAPVPCASMHLHGSGLQALHDPDVRRELSDFAGQTVHAFAGIGRPERFFEQLRRAGLKVIEHAFPDHHVFVEHDFDEARHAIKLLTAKDAVKCQTFGLEDAWVLPVSAVIEAVAADRILEKLKHGREVA